MSDENHYIDELIERYFNASATADEIEELNLWLEADKRHVRQFLRRRSIYDATHPAFAPADINTLRALRSLRSRLHPRRALALWRGVAAAVAMIAIVTAVWVITSRPRVAVEQPPLAEITPPSIPTVTLTLPSGEAIFLDEVETRAIIADSTTMAEGDMAHLAYTPRATEEDTVVWHQLSVPRGNEFFLELSDGTRIWINAETTLRYPARFLPGERKIFVNGEAYLEVAHDATAPFTVVMARNEVTVLGTAFNVNTYPEQPGDRVTLVSGKVRVRAGHNDEQVDLRPGEQAFIPRASGTITKRAVDTRLYCAWKDGVLMFKNNTMDEILQTLARLYDVEIYWHDESLKRYTFTGELKRYESIDTLLRMIGYTDDVKFTVHGKQIIVARP